MTQILEPTLGMLEDQMPNYQDKSLEELPEVRDSILDSMDNIRFLRRVLNTQEAGMRQQLVEVEARIAMLTAATVAVPAKNNMAAIFNGEDQPSCLDCSESAL